jgi:hypothetical protein
MAIEGSPGWFRELLDKIDAIGPPSLEELTDELAQMSNKERQELREGVKPFVDLARRIDESTDDRR